MSKNAIPLPTPTAHLRSDERNSLVDPKTGIQPMAVFIPFFSQVILLPLSVGELGVVGMGKLKGSVPFLKQVLVGE